MTLRRRHLLAAPAVLAALPARAQSWPDRPIRIIVPYTPGAFNDTLARLVGEKLQEKLGQIGVVENRPGASGSIGIAATAQAAPDGYTIAVANTANLAMNPFLFANTGYDPLRDLAPLCVSARLMNALEVPISSGITSLQQLLDRARAQPGKLSYASSGAGSSPHLSAELLKHRTGIDLVHVPYRGSAPATADLIAGRVDMMIDNLPNVLPQVQAGKTRALAVTGNERDPALPDVPTFQEAGLPGYEVYVWFGFVGPAGLPQPIRDRLSAAITAIVTSPETSEKIHRAGATVWTRDQAQFAALLRAELDKWGTVIRSAGLRIE
ncbi:MAG: tripartite tricarboxylate transporter substrate binding protein [Acetobacteraceae bacterium]|nr:tripartite tricarboxylate transporter substrate binding protein [Acetobacteraceae bacterium]